jgi:hypothetical protein
VADPETRGEVERRLGRPFAQVQSALVELFGQEWDEVEIVIETAATKRGCTHADVIAELVGKVEQRPGVQARFRRTLIRWIGKPWRERPNPWDRFQGRLPPVPPKVPKKADDLDEWTPMRPDEDPKAC